MTTTLLPALSRYDAKAKTCVAAAAETCASLHLEAIAWNAAEAGKTHWTVAAAEKLLVRRCCWNVAQEGVEALNLVVAVGMGTLNFAAAVVVVEMSSSGVEPREAEAEEKGRMNLGEVTKNLAAAAMMVVAETMMMNPGREVVAAMMMMKSPKENPQGRKPLEKE